MNEADIRNAARDPSVTGLAPSFRTRLIRPLRGKNAAGTKAKVPGSKSKKANATAALPKVWGLDAIGATTSKLDGSDVVVAVLDTGIMAKHPAFKGVELVEMDFSGDGTGDEDGHGTHCAGTIFGRDVESTRIGVARGVNHALIGKVLGDDGSGDTTMMVRGLLWALHSGANVVSMSLGFDFPGEVQELIEKHDLPPDIAASIALEGYRANVRLFDTVMQLFRDSAPFSATGGCVVVAASGNESRRDENVDWSVNVSMPAAANGVVAVGAAEPKSKGFGIADFSNSIPSVVAPGVAIVSAKAGSKGLIPSDGTSMACPHVAGAVALWWQKLRQGTGPTTYSDVINQLLANADASVFTATTPPEHRGQGMVRCP